MGIFDRLKRKSDTSHEARRVAYQQPPLNMGDYKLQNNEVIFAAVSRISTTLGTMPCVLYNGYEKVEQSIVGDLVSIRPNDNMTPFEFFRTLEVDRQTEGNGYALKIPSLGGGIARLDIVDPARVIPVIDSDTGDVWYRVTLMNMQEIYVHNSEMIHVRHISMDGIRGLRPLDVLRGTLDYSASIASLSLENVRNGVHAGLVLDFPAEMSRPKKEEAVKQFLDVYKQSGGSVIALDAGVRATRLEGSLIDPKLMDVDRITRGRVAAVYTMPPHLLGDYSDTGYGSIEQEMLEFLVLTMTPICEMYRQELNRKLLSDQQIRSGFSFQWDQQRLLLADSASRSNMYFRYLRSAVIKPNEMRAREGLPPEPDGDKLYASRDLVPLEMLGRIETSTTPEPKQMMEQENKNRR